MLGELKDKLTCRADEGYRRLEVESRKDDAKPKAPKLSGGSLRVMGGGEAKVGKRQRLKDTVSRPPKKKIHCQRKR